MLPPDVPALAAASETVFFGVFFFAALAGFASWMPEGATSHGDGHFQGPSSPVVFCAVSCTRTGEHKNRSRKGGQGWMRLPL